MGEKTKKKTVKADPPDLDTRIQIRCSANDVEAWEQHAIAAGFGDRSTWIRKVLNDALKSAR